MALVNIPLGRKAQNHVEWTVVGEEGPGMIPGDIRWQEWNKTCVPPQLSVEFETHDGKRVACNRIGISAEYEKRGWATMRDLYEKDHERKQFWPDWVKFCEAQRSNPRGMKDEDGKDIPFPEDKLPRRVVELRKQGGIAKEKAAAFRFSDGSPLKVEGDKPEPEKKPAKKAASAPAK